MSQILIIDMQNAHKVFMTDELVRDLLTYAKNFQSILYLWDTQCGEELEDQMLESWASDAEFQDKMDSFTKCYGFLRDVMDIGTNEEDMIQLGKFMLKHKVYDASLFEGEVLSEFKKEFKGKEISNIDFDEHGFYLPPDLSNEFLDYVQDGVTIVGGGRKECLKEVCLLLDILDIPYSVNEQFTY